MSSPIKKVAIAGATGSLGQVVTATLAKAGFQVTVLTRDASKATLPAGVKAVAVDYASEIGLRAALEGQHALISAIEAQDPKDQILLFDAAIAAGVKRVIPSEFTSDTIRPENRALPAYANKVALQDHIKEKVAGTDTTYTLVFNNVFLDWGLDNDFFFSRKDKKVQLYDGGDVPFTATPLGRIADGVVGILQHPQETANRAVKISGLAVTQKQVLELYQKHTTSEDWEITTVDTQELLKSGYELLKSDPSNFLGWLYPMLYRAALGKGLPVDWSADGDNDNDLLGVKPVSDAELEAYVQAVVV